MGAKQMTLKFSAELQWKGRGENVVCSTEYTSGYLSIFISCD